MKRLLTFKLQSFVDLITNSSTELFQLRTLEEPQEVYKILSSFTSGFEYPVLFDMTEYRKAMELYREQEQLCLDSDGNQDWQRLQEFEENTPNMELYRTLNGWFFDKEDPEQIEHAYRNYLCNAGWYWDGRRDNLDELQQRFKEFVYKNNYILPGWGEINCLSPWQIEDKAFEEFQKTHDKLSVDFLRPYAEGYGDIEDFEGCIVLIGTDDNSIPYEDWNKINELFNGRNYHLG